MFIFVNAVHRHYGQKVELAGWIQEQMDRSEFKCFLTVPLLQAYDTKKEITVSPRPETSSSSRRPGDWGGGGYAKFVQAIHLRGVTFF